MSDHPEITLRLLIALLCGGLVGLERSYHARPAGFRTHTLVCLASAALMLVTHPDNLRQLSNALPLMPAVAEFRIYPTGD